MNFRPGNPQPPLTWSVDPPGILPPGLALDANTGLLSGTPTAPGQLEFTVRLSDGAGVDSALSFVMQVVNPNPVAPAPLRLSNDLPATVVGNLYMFPLEVSGGQAPYTFQIVSGSFPPGFGLIPSRPNAGQIVGVAGHPAGTTLNIAVQDSSQPQPQIALRRLRFSAVALDPRPSPYADLDFSGSVDLNDHALFQGCLTGPIASGFLPTWCNHSGIQTDEDIDLADFAAFQNEYVLTMP